MVRHSQQSLGGVTGMIFVCGVPLEAMYANLYAQEERKEVGKKGGVGCGALGKPPHTTSPALASSEI